MLEITGTDYCYEGYIQPNLQQLADRVQGLRTVGKLSPDVLYRIRRFFRIKNIYHSNAIEGNVLDVGETRQVVEQGLTLTGKPLKDQAEAHNLSAAIDFLEELAGQDDRPITEHDIRQIHHLVLQGIDEENAGKYRTVSVHISGSEYKPPAPESVAVQMSELSSWLGGVSMPGDLYATVRGLLVAAAAHTWFVTIHPFIDGNGRVARLLMNLLLMRYGFPIGIITKEDRLRYYDALEASQASDLTAFLVLIDECIEESLEEYEKAAEEQQEHNEWAASLARKFTAPERIHARNEYEIWRNAMALLKSYFRQTVNELNQAADFGEIYFKDFGQLEFEKYASLCTGGSAKRTWFLRVDFIRGERSARYLMFFGYANHQLKNKCKVTLRVAREEPEKSFHYEPTDQITAPNVPDLAEVGYDIAEQRFMARSTKDAKSTGPVEAIGKQFFEDIVAKHFSNQ